MTVPAASGRAATSDLARLMRFIASPVDTTRSVGTYNASLGGPATSAAFLARARQQRRYNWDENYTATTANAWIRAGFNMP